MKHLHTLLFYCLLFLSSYVKGQVVNYFKFYSRVSFMPAGGFKKETYQKTKNSITHFSETHSYQKPKEIFRKTLSIDSDFKDEILELDSLLRLKSFTLVVDSSLIFELKIDTFKKKYYQVNDIDIDRFFANKKTITLSLEEIKADTLDEYTVYDGRPFTLNFAYKIGSQDTTDFKYYGNLDDGVKTKDLKYWLPIFILINKHKLFSTNKYLTDFFDNNILRSVLFRFIKWQSV